MRYLPSDLIDIWYLKVDINQYDISAKDGENWIEDLKIQFEQMIDKHQEHKIRGMEQISQMAVKPLDHKIYPESTWLDDVIDDLTIPEKT